MLPDIQELRTLIYNDKIDKLMLIHFKIFGICYSEDEKGFKGEIDTHRELSENKGWVIIDEWYE